MKHANRILACILALIVCLGVLHPLPAAAAEVCFTAVNERVLEVDDDTMPVWSGGALYAPYTTFDSDQNGVMWSVECRYSKSDNRITVFDLEQSLVLEFDLREGTCLDGLTGEAYEQGAILRGGLPFLPVGLVCGFFGLTYSYRTIDQGKILRIRDGDAVLTDRDFLSAAQNVINSRLKEYHQSQSSSEPPTPSAPLPSIPEAPVVSQQVESYLAFRCSDPIWTEAVLTVLQSRNVYGMFFLPADLIRQHSDLVFRILGSGHCVGLLTESIDPDAARTELEACAQALARQVFLRTEAVWTPAELREGAKNEGLICWNDTVDLIPTDTTGANYFSSRILERLEGHTDPVYLSLPADSNAVRILPTLLRELEDKGFLLRTPLETRL